MNNVYMGKSVSSGFAIGRICVFHKDKIVIACEQIENAEEEIVRYEEASNAAALEVSELYEKALREMGAEQAAIFEAQGMILVDEEYNAFVRYTIKTQMVNAEYAVQTTCEHFVAMFLNMEDEYFRARSVDVKDVSCRLLRILEDCKKPGKSEKGNIENKMSEPYIVVAEELTPGETMLLKKEHLQGMVTKYGSTNSHTAILAGTMNIPALSEIEISESMDGQIGIVDGFAGRLILSPDEETLDKYRRKIQKAAECKERLQQYRGISAVDARGKKIPIYANIGETVDLKAAWENDAEGIGLFRSEMLYLTAEDYPTEETLFLVYRQVLETMQGKKVILRTLDIGADKKVEYFQLKQEENPALGCRAIRICLKREELFRTQLRAMIRAGACGNLAIMYPMITSVGEVRKIRALVEEIKAELSREGIPSGSFEQGIMIETPAAALISDLLAREVDFFSIGTNDLIQYTLAADRQNPEMEPYYDVHHEAVLRLIQMTIENGHKAGIKVGMCGELAADTTMTKTFLEWGIDELSVVPGKVLEMRKTVLEG